MSELVYWLISMSFVAAVAGCCVLLLRRWRRLPRKWCFLLWGIPLLRFWVPFSIQGDYSLMNLFSKWAHVVPVKPGSPMTSTNYLGFASGYFPLEFPSTDWVKLFDTVALVWCVVAAALLLTFGFLYVTTMRAVRAATPVEGNLYRSDAIDSPAVFGLFAPRIVVPASYKEEDLPLILLHEQTHIRRGDNWWRMLAFVTAALHWFNPFIWWFLKAFLEDMELSCDEKVLDRCEPEQRKTYARLLLDCLEKRTLFVSAFGGARIRVRLNVILSHKKLSLFATVCLAVLALVVGYLLLTNAAIV